LDWVGSGVGAPLLGGAGGGGFFAFWGFGWVGVGGTGGGVSEKLSFFLSGKSAVRGEKVNRR